MNYFSVSIPILEVPKARRSQKDKFVTVGVPEAEIMPIFLFDDFKFVSLYRGPKKLRISGGG